MKKTQNTDEILLQIQQTRRELLSTESWKHRKDLRRHIEKLQTRLDKLRGKEERKQNERQSGRGMSGRIYFSEGMGPTLTTNKGEGSKIAIPIYERTE